MSLEDLETELAAAVGHDPDRWAFAAFRVAVARSESATTNDDVNAALQLLDRAGRILTAERSPVEHARILTGAANCNRQLGEPGRAQALFEVAAGLLATRVPPAEHAAALTNLGLAHIEVGRPSLAVEPLTEAIDLIAPEANTADGVAARRVRGAALLNRAQANQAASQPESLVAATADYRSAVNDFDDEAPQRGMALHGLGAAILELERRGGGGRVDDALDAFHRCLRILTSDAFPFQHALAQHSLGVAYERRSDGLDLARALNCVEMAMSILDPRLHKAQWLTAAETLARVEAQLNADQAPMSRIGHIVRLMTEIDESERGNILRERLGRLSHLPVERVRRDLAQLASALTQTTLDDYDVVVRSMVPVLMELPDIVLEGACAELCAAHQNTDDQLAYDAALDAVVHALLHGPQRVRVRDMLELHGWVRP